MGNYGVEILCGGPVSHNPFSVHLSATACGSLGMDEIRLLAVQSKPARRSK